MNAYSFLCWDLSVDKTWDFHCVPVWHVLLQTLRRGVRVPIWAACTLRKLLPCSLGGWGEEKPCVVFVASQSSRIMSLKSSVFSDRSHIFLIYRICTLDTIF